MNRFTVLVVTLMVIASSAMADGVDLSAVISHTYSHGRKCAPINGRVGYRLPSDTPAEVFFDSRGWVKGYLRGGDLVYAVPDGSPCNGEQWYRITHTVRCGNEAKGRFMLPVPVTPIPEVILMQSQGPERVVTVERIVTRTVPQIVTVTLPAPVFLPQRQYIAPAGVSSVWTPALPVATGSISVGPWQDRVWLTLVRVPTPRAQSCKTPTPSGTCDPNEGPPPPPPVELAGKGTDVPSGSQGPGSGDQSGYLKGGMPDPTGDYGSNTHANGGPGNNGGVPAITGQSGAPTQ